MESNHHPRIDLGAPEPDHRPLTWSDSPPSSQADPLLWQHEVSVPAPARTTSGHVKVLASVVAIGVLLGTGFAVGAPLYALTRWWASTPVATTASQETTPVAAPTNDIAPIPAAPPRAEAAQEVVFDEEVLTVSDVLAAARVAGADSDEAPTRAAAAAEVVGEPRVADPRQSERPAASMSVDHVVTDGVRIDPVSIDEVSIDPVAVESFAINPVVIDAVTIDPVVIDPVEINLPTSGPAGAR